MPINVNTPPPKKLSDLIDLAINDARNLNRDRYTPLWSTWHEPHEEPGRCMMCLAGSVIAGTLGYPIGTTVEVTTKELATTTTAATVDDDGWREALWALDSAREGDWIGAFSALHGNYPEDGVYESLEQMDPACETEFDSWETLDTHLESMTERVTRLREMGL